MPLLFENLLGFISRAGSASAAVEEVERDLAEYLEEQRRLLRNPGGVREGRSVSVTMLTRGSLNQF